PAAKRYSEIHAHISNALARLGVATESVGRTRAVLVGAGPAPCFSAPVCGDLMSNGQKLVGGAQRRTRDGVLHQGSLQPIPAHVGRSQLADALANELGENCRPIAMDAEKIRQADALAKAKYAASDWLRAR